MKNNFLNIIKILIFILILQNQIYAEELIINSSKIKIEQQTKITILEGNVKATDVDNNQIFANYAKYDKNNQIFETVGVTKIIT